MRDIDNSENTISIRDLDIRRDELQADADALSEAVEEAREALESVDEEHTDPKELADMRETLRQAEAALEEWAGGDDDHELAILNDLADEAIREAGDGRDGTMIRESYWETYMDEFLEDIGEIPKNLPPYLTITVDYDALKMDYTKLDYDGVTYLVRS